MKIPRILLSAGASGSGKTLLTCGLLQVLVNRNKKVASFKCGPDYIDPMFHTRVIGAKSRNLDTFFTTPEITGYLLAKNAQGCDISVMEGVMGYYDGAGGTTTKASAFDLAQVTKTPVVLIVNSRGMSVSLAAYIKGFLDYRRDSGIRGVIFNQMSSMLYPRMKELVEKELSVHVYGYVPKITDCLIESRHLGLVLPEEIPDLQKNLKKLASVLEETLEIDGLIKLAESAEELVPVRELPEEYGSSDRSPVRIGLADDEAFCFFYEDNLRLLREWGAELISFSPVHDGHLPEKLDGLLLYGGYPELSAKTLSENVTMREEIKEALLRQKMPCMAECGGFMYLHESMEDMEENAYPMCGVIPGRAYRTKKLSRFGYIMMSENEGSSVFGQKSFGSIPAHEFHYFDSESCGEAFHACKPESRRSWNCMHGNDTMLAGFPHLYYYGNPLPAKGFMAACRSFRDRRGGER